MSTIYEMIDSFVAALPRHDCALHIEHNPHKSVYQSVEAYTNGNADAWVSETERQRAVEAGELWVLQWYPDTPVGHYMVYASSLAAVIVGARSVKE